MKRTNPLRNVTNEVKTKDKKAEKDIIYKLYMKERNNILMYTEYFNSSISHFKKIEDELCCNPNYMNFQEHLSWGMRSALLDWVIDIHNKMTLLPETLYFAINLIDRFLSIRSVSVSKLKLVAIAALFIASKYEEVVFPTLETFLLAYREKIVDKDLIDAEKYMLYTLECYVEYPSPNTFCNICLKFDEYDGFITIVSQYILERMFLDENFIKYVGSIKACCAVYVAKCITNKRQFLANIPSLLGYSMERISKCMEDANETLKRPCMFRYLCKKYENTKFGDVVSIVDIYFNRLKNK